MLCILAGIHNLMNLYLPRWTLFFFPRVSRVGGAKQMISHFGKNSAQRIPKNHLQTSISNSVGISPWCSHRAFVAIIKRIFSPSFHKIQNEFSSFLLPSAEVGSAECLKYASSSAAGDIISNDNLNLFPSRPSFARRRLRHGYASLCKLSCLVHLPSGEINYQPMKVLAAKVEPISPVSCSTTSNLEILL